jgi:hypothetical protein
MSRTATLHRYRVALGIFIAGLVLSGLTAFPLLQELELLASMLGIPADAAPASFGGLQFWIATVRDGMRDVHANHPWLAYGTDWLAFAHLIIALFFIGPWRDPAANAWVLKVGLAACAGVILLALICGGIRSIPLYWRLIDCSFGVFGALPLAYCLKLTARLRGGEFQHALAKEKARL